MMSKHFCVTIRFLQPIREMIRAVCLMPDAEELAAFHERLEAKGSAKITLQVHVEENGVLAARFEGVFVAVKDPPAKS